MAEEKQGALDQMFETNAKTERKTQNRGGSDMPITVNGYDRGEVVSALQKAIRRSNEVQALFWASELMASDQSYQMWRRLLVIAAEDVGLADPDMVPRIMLMKQAHDMGREWNIPFLAVMLLCRSPKNREADDAAYLYELRRKEGWKLKVPPEAQDGHTRQGRSRLYRIARETGEDWEHVWCREFYYDAALLKNYVPDGEGENTDPWRRRLMRHLDLPFETYELEECPQPRLLTGTARTVADEYEERRMANRIPSSIQYRRYADPVTGEFIEDQYVVKSFTGGDWYVVNMIDDTCTCAAFEKGGGGLCKHLVAMSREKLP